MRWILAANDKIRIKCMPFWWSLKIFTNETKFAKSDGRLLISWRRPRPWNRELGSSPATGSHETAPLPVWRLTKISSIRRMFWPVIKKLQLSLDQCNWSTAKTRLPKWPTMRRWRRNQTLLTRSMLTRGILGQRSGCMNRTAVADEFMFRPLAWSGVRYEGVMNSLYLYRTPGHWYLTT